MPALRQVPAGLPTEEVPVPRHVQRLVVQPIEYACHRHAQLKGMNWPSDNLPAVVKKIYGYACGRLMLRIRISQCGETLADASSSYDFRSETCTILAHVLLLE